jgi:hypothetical protein
LSAVGANYASRQNSCRLSFIDGQLSIEEDVFHSYGIGKWFGKRGGIGDRIAPGLAADLVLSISWNAFQRREGVFHGLSAAPNLAYPVKQRPPTASISIRNR